MGRVSFRKALSVASMYDRDGHKAWSLSTIEGLLIQYPGNAYLLRRKATLLERSATGDEKLIKSKVEKLLRKSLELDIDSAPALYEMGEYLSVQENDCKKAALYFRKSIATATDTLLLSMISYARSLTDAGAEKQAHAVVNRINRLLRDHRKWCSPAVRIHARSFVEGEKKKCLQLATENPDSQSTKKRKREKVTLS